MRKTLYAFAAVGLALWATFQNEEQPLTPDEVFLFGPEVPVAPAVEVLLTSRSGSFARADGFGNAVLVDSELGLYLTNAHLIAEDCRVGWVGSSSTGWTRVTVRDRWVDQDADLAVVRAISTERCRSIRALPVSDFPPERGQMLTVPAYHVVAEAFHNGRLTHMHGFMQSYQVIRSETDGCADRLICVAMDWLRGRILLGEELSFGNMRVFYPHQIYAAYRGESVLGIIPGMSGSPAINRDGTIVGLTRAYNDKSDPAGRYAFFAPAYRARPLIAQAQRDCRTASDQ